MTSPPATSGALSSVTSDASATSPKRDMNSDSVDLLHPGGTAATKSAVPSSAPSAPLDGARRKICLENAAPK